MEKSDFIKLLIGINLFSFASQRCICIPRYVLINNIRILLTLKYTSRIIPEYIARLKKREDKLYVKFRSYHCSRTRVHPFTGLSQEAKVSNNNNDKRVSSRGLCAFYLNFCRLQFKRKCPFLQSIYLTTDAAMEHEFQGKDSVTDITVRTGT